MLLFFSWFPDSVVPVRYSHGLSRPVTGGLASAAPFMHTSGVRQISQLITSMASVWVEIFDDLCVLHVAILRLGRLVC